MIAEELASIPAWVDREVVNRNLPRLYTELASAVQQNARGSHQPFESQREALLAQLKDVNIHTLTNAQIEFLNRLNLLDHVGDKGVKELEDVLYRNALDISTASSTLNRISSEIQNAVDRSNQIKVALSGLVSPTEQPKDEFLLRVVFDRDASIGNVVDLKKWANDWHDIARGFAMAVGESPEQLRVLSAQTGSIIIVFATTFLIVRTFSSVLLKALEVAEKVQGIRKAALEIESLKLSNEELARKIRTEAEEEKKLGLEKITSDVQGELANMDGEQVNSLDKAIRKLLDFVEKGGEVDIVLPLSTVETDGDQETNKLHMRVERIRELERETRRLSHASGD